MNSVEINALTKSFGKTKALNNISLEVPEGSIYGLVGPNGSGKTTIIKALVGAVIPTSGVVKVLGQNPLKNIREVRKQIGYMPQTPSIYGDLSARQNITFFGKAHNIVNINQEVEQILDFTELSKRADEPIRNFSGGMQKRVSLACALIHYPKILFLDEPTAAVDPHLKKRSWELFKKLALKGVTIFVSTHLMDEALLCDKIAILRNGELLKVDSPTNIMALGKSKLKFTLNGAVQQREFQSTYEDFTIELKSLGLKKEIENVELENENLEDIILKLVDTAE